MKKDKISLQEFCRSYRNTNRISYIDINNFEELLFEDKSTKTYYKWSELYRHYLASIDD